MNQANQKDLVKCSHLIDLMYSTMYGYPQKMVSAKLDQRLHVPPQKKREMRMAME